MPEPFDETDAAIARKLADIAPPADLRARLLAAAAPAPAAVESRPARGWARGITALAAVLAIAFAVLLLRPAPGESLSTATAELSQFLSAGFPLGMKTNDVSQVREWLAANNPSHPVAVPDALAAQNPIGCRELNWRDHTGSLACFSLGGGQEAHLAMFPSDTFSDAPGRTPQVASAGKWTRAAWSKDGMTYLLFVPVGMDPVKEFLALAWRDADLFRNLA